MPVIFAVPNTCMLRPRKATKLSDNTQQFCCQQYRWHFGVHLKGVLAPNFRAVWNVVDAWIAPFIAPRAPLPARFPMPQPSDMMVRAVNSVCGNPTQGISEFYSDLNHAQAYHIRCLSPEAAAGSVFLGHLGLRCETSPRWQWGATTAGPTALTSSSSYVTGAAKYATSWNVVFLLGSTAGVGATIANHASTSGRGSAADLPRT